MKIAYFDCFAGISGDMILGALLDAGLHIKELESELRKLKMKEYKINAEKTTRGGISGTKFIIEIRQKVKQRKLKEVMRIIEQSTLEEQIKNLSKQVFKELASVEAAIHRTNIQDVHFHETGSLDSIIDVVGSFIGIKKLKLEAIYASRIHVGGGFVRCEHGVLPAPTPATLSLLTDIPIYSNGINEEIVTPTGACILKIITRNFGNMPPMKLIKIGYGAGSRELPIPNLLRLCIGERHESKYEKDEVILIETNIDNINAEVLAYTFERLFEQGALDVFMTPIFMKKNRAGTLLSVLTAEDKFDAMLSTIFRETTTLGVRFHRLKRYKLSREIVSVQTKFGEVEVKISRVGDQLKHIAPEYEMCKETAMKQKVSLQEVYDEARKAAAETLNKKNKMGSEVY